MIHRSKNRKSGQQSGLTLIELMIAMVVLAVGILGSMALPLQIGSHIVPDLPERMPWTTGSREGGTLSSLFFNCSARRSAPRLHHFGYLSRIPAIAILMSDKCGRSHSWA